MDIRKISPELSVSPQIAPGDVAAIAEAGFRSILCNRPNGEATDQPDYELIEAEARKAGLEFRFEPISRKGVIDDDVDTMRRSLMELPGPVLAYCRTGTRCCTCWSLTAAETRPLTQIMQMASAAGYDMSGIARRIAAGGRTPSPGNQARFDVVIVGAGAGGIAAAASLHKRRPDLDIAIIEPAGTHYYQPGWSLVGGGFLEASTTARTMGSLIPRGVHWIKAPVVAFAPKSNAVVLEGGETVGYDRLVVTPGIQLNWNAIDGLTDTLGRGGVTSNYRYDLAPYTWELIKSTREGRAIFTQPPAPIKCPGAPLKAMYLAADYWREQAVLPQIDTRFMTAADTLFGARDYVPALQHYVDRYGVGVDYHHSLVAVDGAAGKAWFDVAEPGKTLRRIETEFAMLHVTPPQSAPDFIRVSPLADRDGWVDVNPATLRHATFENIWALGDVTNTPNSKTAAAARAQAPVLAENLCDDIDGRSPTALYTGYGSCPITVERGKIVLAEFGYGGVLMPTLPGWMIDGTQASRRAWFLKERILPPVYWKAMLRGREWLVHPERASG